MYKLKYFQSGRDLCGSDFKNENKIEYINLQQISSISDIKKFNLPFSGNYAGEYVVVRMSNGSIFYIYKEEFDELLHNTG